MKKGVIEILLVEDNEYDIELTLRALHEDRLANTIHVARDGEEALTFLADCEASINRSEGVMPKLILLDLKLPKVDGHEVLRQVKNNPALKMIPVVVLTSSKQDEDMLKSYLIGVNSYIQKPMNFEQFRKIVKDLGLYWLVVNQLPSPLATGARWFGTIACRVLVGSRLTESAVFAGGPKRYVLDSNLAAPQGFEPRYADPEST